MYQRAMRRTVFGVVIGFVVVLVGQFVVRALVDDPDPPRRPAPQVSVAAEPGLRFSEAVLRVPVGGKGVFRNSDAVEHTFTADGGLFDSGRVAPGASFTFSFAAAGEVTYHCEIHPSMKGRVVVEGEG